MALGERIKQARLEKGLSQRQLCGDTVTRNMLSLIESGKARPGMDTLTVLAARLEKPVSWFLDEEAVLRTEDAVTDKARKAYARGNYSRAVRELESLFRRTGEQALLLSASLTELARGALEEGELLHARSLLEQAEQAIQGSLYDCPALRADRKILLAKADPGAAGEVAGELSGLTDGLLLLQAQAAQGEQAARYLDAVVHREDRWYFCRGKAALEMGQYQQAAEYLHRAEETQPEQCAPLLEACYRELGDYKRAYEYACRQKK